MPFCSSYLISHHCRHSLITFYIFIYIFYIPLLRQSWQETLVLGWVRNWVPYGDKKVKREILLLSFWFCSCRVANRNSQSSAIFLLCVICRMHISHFSVLSKRLFSLNILWQYVHICLLYVFGMFIHVFQFISMWTMRPCPSTQIQICTIGRAESGAQYVDLERNF